VKAKEAQAKRAKVGEGDEGKIDRPALALASIVKAAARPVAGVALADRRLCRPIEAASA
jgi:hypothetical protein